MGKKKGADGAAPLGEGESKGEVYFRKISAKNVFMCSHERRSAAAL